MSKEIKMADVFNLPAKQDESRHFRYVVYTVPDDNVIISANSAKEAEYLTHAINNHDRLSDEVSALRERLHSLFERVSGCEVSEFSSEQVNYLADMIEGQMDANEGCINKIKSENAALRESLRLKEAECDSLSSDLSRIVSAASDAHLSGSEQQHVDHLYRVIRDANGKLYTDEPGGDDENQQAD